MEIAAGTQGQRPGTTKPATGKKELRPEDPLDTVIARVLSDPFKVHQESLPLVVEGSEYSKFKREVIEAIVKNRVYKDKDLAQLYQRMTGKYSSLDKGQLDKIWGEIIDDFSS